MVKTGYFSNSSKFMAAVSAFLFIANGFVVIGEFTNDKVSSYATMFSSLSLYVVLILGYVALNGEGLGHKRARDRKSKKATGYLKFLLLFVFLYRFIKAIPEQYAVSFSADSFAGILFRFVASILSTVGSYGFFVAAVSLWYVIRDGENKKLVPIEATAFISGVLYNLFKMFNYAVGKYGVTALGDIFIRIFTDKYILHTLCLLQFFLDTIMFIVVAKYYNGLSIEEEEQNDKSNHQLIPARSVYEPDGFGIDDFEDKFLEPNTVT